MFYCSSFTDDDIPDKLWQEAEYGINQQGNDLELENLLNFKIFKNLEVILHPAMRSFFEIGRDANSPQPNMIGSRELLTSASNMAQPDEMLGRLGSFSQGEDR